MKPYLISLLLFLSLDSVAQNFPWNSPLKMATSMDGITFNTPSIFQDSSGVPCVIRWKGDTLIAAFQWFRQPNPSPTWDRVAVKFSYDNGVSWTQPLPIIVNGLPPNHQRPFDPALTVFGGDSLRIFFSSSNGMPSGGLDSSINTYSATSTDGVHYNFETKARVDELMSRVIDPSVIYFNNMWHYLAPVGAPQQGAYHYISADGITFSPVPLIPSDASHNWTGNYMVNAPNELRFYGSGNYLWYNTSPNGGAWNGYVNTNLHGGDPGVVKLGTNSFLMVYVGEPYKTGITNVTEKPINLSVSPNPAKDFFFIQMPDTEPGTALSVFDGTGRLVFNVAEYTHQISIDCSTWPAGIYSVVFAQQRRLLVCLGNK